MFGPLLLTAITLAAPNLKGRSPKADLVGEWVVESTTVNGTTRAPAGDELVYEFTRDGQWLIRRGPKELAGPNRGYTVNTQANPPHVDLMTDTTRPDVTGRQGIFKVEGDTATLCVGPPRGPRATAFTSDAENRNTIYLLRRVKRPK